MWRLALLAGALFQTGCVSAPPKEDSITLTVAGPAIPAAQAGPSFLYVVPGTERSSGPADQQWSMLGREDRAALSGTSEYHAKPCERLVGQRAEWLDEIVAQASARRVVIVNESHTVTRHRDTVRRILTALRPLGYTVYAAETFSNRGQPTSIEANADLPWPHVADGTYTMEPTFGRLVREAKRLGFRLAAYENTARQEAPDGADVEVRIATREAAQAENLAAILAIMGPEEKLIVHVGYSHASEVPVAPNGVLWMAARLQRLTGIDPLTISQTLCASEGGEPFLARLPAEQPTGLVDLILSQPVTRFERSRPTWRKAAGDIAVSIPQELRAAGVPVVVEAFRPGEPNMAVPIDRVYVEPGENIPLLLPPGDYTVRGIVPAAAPQ